MNFFQKTRGNFSYMLTGIVMVLLAVALTEQFPGSLGELVMPFITIFGMGISIFTIINDRALFRFSIGLLALAFVLGALNISGDQLALRFFQLLAFLAVFIIMAVVAFHRVLFTGKVTNNKITGAICIYLLLGMIWAMLYSLILEIGVGEFNNLSGDDWPSRFANLIYFSYVCLSTLGFGDLTPLTPLLRFLAYMEALVGQFYLAILVASLIGARFSSDQSGK